MLGSEGSSTSVGVIKGFKDLFYRPPVFGSPTEPLLKEHDLVDDARDYYNLSDALHNLTTNLKQLGSLWNKFQSLTDLIFEECVQNYYIGFHPVFDTFFIRISEAFSFAIMSEILQMIFVD